MKKCVMCGKVITNHEPFVGFCSDEDGFTYCMKCFDMKESNKKKK